MQCALNGSRTPFKGIDVQLGYCVLSQFNALGRRGAAPPTGPRLWIIRTNQSHRPGRAWHEATLRSMQSLDFAGMCIRWDRAPMDTLERRVASIRLA